MMPSNSKRRRTVEATQSDLDGLSDQLQSVSLAISAALNREHEDEDDVHQKSMEELRQWYQTEVFAATDAQQQRWEERRWAFLGQLQQRQRRHYDALHDFRIQARGAKTANTHGLFLQRCFIAKRRW